MPEEVLPPHLVIAKDVTEGEYHKAKLQNRITLIATFAVPLVLFLYWMFVNATFLSSNGEPPFKISIIWAISANRGLYFLLKEGRKMKTVRMIRYAELRTLREFRKNNPGPDSGD